MIRFAEVGTGPRIVAQVLKPGGNGEMPISCLSMVLNNTLYSPEYLQVPYSNAMVILGGSNPEALVRAEQDTASATNFLWYSIDSGAEL